MRPLLLGQSPSPSPTPTLNPIVNPAAQLVEQFRDGVRAFLQLLPGIVTALVVLLLFWLVARVVRRRLRPRLSRMRTPSFGRVFSTLIFAAIMLIGFVVALPIAFPSLSVANMLGGLGLLGVAAGFAFQDILSNLLAGVLLIFRQPFVSGDQIEVNGLTGTVEGITIRETRLKTYDGRLVVIPNADVYTNAITVQTAYDRVRSSFVTGVGYGTDLADARQVALDALSRVDGVLDEPTPEAYFVEHGSSAVLLDLRYWTRPYQAEIRAVQNRVVEAVFGAFNAAGVDIPFDIVTLDAGESFAEVMRPSR